MPCNVMRQLQCDNVLIPHVELKLLHEINSVLAERSFHALFESNVVIYKF